MTTPFIIYALPRSRTAWLSNFLTYKAWECHHEVAIYMRSMEDVRNFFSSPKIGCVETAAAQGRPLIHHVAPNIKEVVILRPMDEVVESMMAVDISGVGIYDRKILQRNMEYGDRELRKIAKDKNVLAINYSDLNREDSCAAIFEHCLPFKFDKKWWEWVKDKNIQADVKSILRYYQQNRDAVEVFKRHCKKELIRLYRIGEIKRMKYA